MSRSQIISAFTAPGHLRWLSDGDIVLIVDQQVERSWLLDGQAAVLWSRLPGTTSFSKLVEQWMILYGENRATAESSLRYLLDCWLTEGLLVPMEEQA